MNNNDEKDFSLGANIQEMYDAATAKKFKAIETAIEVYNNRKQKIKTSHLNEVMLAAIEEFLPPSVKVKYIKIKYITQIPTHTPAFAFYCNHPQHVKESYKRFLENKLREHFDFHGVPVSVYMHKK